MKKPTKLERAKELFYLYKLTKQLKAECVERMNKLTPQALQAEAEETIRKVTELEMVHAELQQKLEEWDADYADN